MKWTGKEIKHLKKGYNKKTYKELAGELNRSYDSVKSKAATVKPHPYPNSRFQKPPRPIETASLIEHIEFCESALVNMTGSIADPQDFDFDSELGELVDDLTHSKEEYDRRIGYMWEHGWDK